MEYIRLGSTNLMVSRTGFGAFGFSRLSEDEGIKLLRSAYEGGINLFDISLSDIRGQKLLAGALGEIRRDIRLTVNSLAQTGEQLAQDIENALDALGTDYIDICQIQYSGVLPVSGAADGLYDTLLSLYIQNKIRSIGISLNDFEGAKQAISSGFYNTIRYPLNLSSSDEELSLVDLCVEKDVGLIAMQPLCGGLIENVPLAFGFLRRLESIVPLWGAKNEEELQQLLYFEERPPVIDQQFLKDIEQERQNIIKKLKKPL